MNLKPACDNTASAFGRPFVKRFALCYLSVCDVSVLWPNGWLNQDATWYGDRHQSRRLQQSPPHFWVHGYCG